MICNQVSIEFSEEKIKEWETHNFDTRKREEGKNKTIITRIVIHEFVEKKHELLFINLLKS
jgi:hypothetical protein